MIVPKRKLPDLPVCAILPGLQTAIGKGSAVLAAPPGSGKTTLIPLALLDEPWLSGKKILILEPRRLAARTAAARMASLLGEQVGQTVGYRIRFDTQVCKTTRIEVLTEGILTRRLQNDTELADIGLIIFDEFHERSVHADLALALCLDLCQVKEDLRLLVMSATLDTEPLAGLLGGVPVITTEGKSHEVTIEYLQRPPTGRIAEVTLAGIRRVIRERSGDLLVFLPGVGEIRELHRLLDDSDEFSHLLISPLYGNLSQRDQDRAIMPDSRGNRRIILATSIAETSLTIEGIGCVVDSGWSRRPQFNPATGLSTLTTVRVSKAAASQRAGRAGRLGPGYCLRLWTRGEHGGLLDFHPPEIVSVDPAGLALELALWGVSEPEELRWLDPPRSGPYLGAKELLQSLEAIDRSGHITDSGRQLAALPIHPRLGHMLLMAKKAGHLLLACDIAAIISERDILKKDGGTATADLGLRLQLLHLWRKDGAEAVYRRGGDPGICRPVDRTAESLRKLVGGGSSPCDRSKVGDLLVYAYPDRIARRRPGQRERYQLASGRGAVLPPGDLLAASEYLVIAHLDAGQKEGRIFLAEGLDIADLRRDHSRLFAESRQVYWDEALARVVAVHSLSLGQLIIEQQPVADAAVDEISLAMLTGIRQMGKACLPWNDKARQFQARVDLLRRLQPENDWPDLSDDALLTDLDWLAPYLGGLSRADQLRQIDLLEIFKGLLGWPKQQQLDQEAPTSLLVPSGSKIAIEYQPGQAPVLAVRIQEMFGLAETPAICGGKVVLLLHLLSPARRPIQITSDLAGFWQNSYPEVKKELKGRYPKHHWPDDPLTAEASRTVRRKKK